MTPKIWINILICAGYFLTACPGSALGGEERIPMDTSSDILMERVALENLLKIALEKNPGIRQAKAEWEASKKRKPQSWALPDPMIGMDIMGGMTETRVGPQEDRLMVSQNIPFPLKLWKRRSVASEEANAAFESYQAVVREVMNRTRQTFYELYWTDGSIEVIEEIHELLKKFEGAASARYADGSGAQRDVAKAQAEVSLTLEQLFMLEQKRESQAGMINALLDRSPLLGFGKAEKPELPHLEKTLYELITLASRNRQEIRAEEARLKSTKHKETLARLENFPDLRAGFTYTWVGSGETTSTEDGKDSWMFPLAINIPLWQNRNIPAIAEAKKEWEAADAKLSAVRNDTFYEVKDAHVRYETGRKILTLYETAVIPQAKIALSSDHAGYEGKRTDFLNLLDSERVYLNAVLSHIKIYTDVLRSFSDLERAVGVDLTEKGAA